jgi:hypothetical protein
MGGTRTGHGSNFQAAGRHANGSQKRLLAATASPLFVSFFEVVRLLIFQSPDVARVCFIMPHMQVVISMAFNTY